MSSIRDRDASVEKCLATRDVSCLVALMMFVLSNAFGAADVATTNRWRTENDERWYALDPTVLRERWGHHVLARDVRTAAGVLNALGWCAFLLPTVRTATVLSKNWQRRSGAHLWMILLAFAAFFSELMCRLTMLGMENVVDWASREFNLENWGVHENGKADDVGWRVVELLATINRGVVVWVDVFEWLAMGGIASIVYLSLTADVDRAFPDRFRTLSGVVAIVSFFTFALNVFRIDDHKVYAVMHLSYVSLNVFVLYPLWFGMLAKHLPAASEALEARETHADRVDVVVD